MSVKLLETFSVCVCSHLMEHFKIESDSNAYFLPKMPHYKIEIYTIQQMYGNLKTKEHLYHDETFNTLPLDL